jgi:hypothetical protein
VSDANSFVASKYLTRVIAFRDLRPHEKAESMTWRVLQKVLDPSGEVFFDLGNNTSFGSKSIDLATERGWIVGYRREFYAYSVMLNNWDIRGGTLCIMYNLGSKKWEKDDLL